MKLLKHLVIWHCRVDIPLLIELEFEAIYQHIIHENLDL